MSVNYAPKEYIEKMNQYETQNRSNIKTQPIIPNMDDYNKIWDPNDVNRLTNPGLPEIKQFNQDYSSTYKFEGVELAPSVMRGEYVNIGCRTPLEYSNTAPEQMTRLDKEYTHTFESCRTKAILQEYPYFAVTKPAGSDQRKNEYHCYVAKNISNSTNYYDYVTVWSLAPGVISFGLSQDGDIIIDATNIETLGMKNIQNVSFSTEDKTYTLGDYNTFVPISPMSFNVYVFSLTQIRVRNGFIYDTMDGTTGSYALGTVSRLDNTDNKFILMVNDLKKKCIKMIGVEFSLINKILHAKVFGAKKLPTQNPIKTIEIISSYDWLQISEIAVYNENGVDVSKYATVEASEPWPRSSASNANSQINQVKPYHTGYHSLSPGTPFYRLTFPNPVYVSKIVYYNRAEAWQYRSAGYTLTARDENNANVFQTGFTEEMIQTFNIPIPKIDSMFDPNMVSTLWKKSEAVPCEIITSSNTRNGYGLKGLTIDVLKDGFKTDEAGFTILQNKMVNSGIRYAKYDGIKESECKAKCMNTLNCKTYSISNKRIETIATPQPFKDLGGWGDRNERALATYLGQAEHMIYCAELAAKNPETANNRYFSLQYGGQCFSDNREKAQGYGRYGPSANCGTPGGGWCNKWVPVPEMGGGWSNRVYEKTPPVLSSNEVVSCDLYGPNDITTSDSPGAITGTRSTITRPVNTNTTGINLTNNILKNDMPLCKNDDPTCRLYIELGGDGNIKLIKSLGDNNMIVYWNLFEYDPSVKENISKLNNIIPNEEWKKVSNTPNNILSPGSFIYNKPPTGTEKTSITSTDGKFKLEIINGVLQLKTMVYGCFSSDPSYKADKVPIYTQEVQNKPNSYYVYNAKLDGLTMEQPYYMVTGYNQKLGIRPIDKKSNVLVNTNEYGHSIFGFRPTPEDTTGQAAFRGTLEQCQAECNKNANCKYIYFGLDRDNNKTQNCFLGNKDAPAYIGEIDDFWQDSPKYQHYILHKRMKKLNIDTDEVPSNSSANISIQGFRNMQNIQEGITIKAEYGYGKEIKNTGEVGRYATPSGVNLKDKLRIAVNEGGVVDPKLSPPPPPPDDPNYKSAGRLPKITTFQKPPPSTNQPATLGGMAIDKAKTLSTSGIVAGIRSATEGFDNHAYTGKNENCGKIGQLPCETSILYGQIKPLQKIANDYSNSTAKINTQYRDLSRNIIDYNTIYSQVNADKKYDFNTNYPIDLNPRPDLHTVRHSDSTQIALQSNNMYIAGSMLTTAILISAIYLGRS